jgi:hypothetical protein
MNSMGICLAVLMLGVGTTALAARADTFQIVAAKTHLANGVYLLDAEVQFDLGQRPLDALKNGVPLVIENQIEITQRNNWLPDNTVAALSQRYQLKFHPLTEQYLVTNLNSGERQNFRTMGRALAGLGTLRGLPILDDTLLDPGAAYTVRMRVGIDLEALPTPLRLLAYVYGDWRAKSQWQEWQL